MAITPGKTIPLCGLPGGAHPMSVLCRQTPIPLISTEPEMFRGDVIFANIQPGNGTNTVRIDIKPAPGSGVVVGRGYRLFVEYDLTDGSLNLHMEQEP